MSQMVAGGHRFLCGDLAAALAIASLVFHATQAGAAPGNTQVASQRSAGLVVAEASGGLVKISSTSPEVRLVLTVVNPTNKAISGVVALWTEFSDATGSRTSVSAKPDGQPFPVAPYGQQALILTASLRSPGVHIARMWLSEGGNAVATTIEVTRTDKQPTVSIGNLLPFKVDAPWWGAATSQKQHVPIALAGAKDGLSLPAPKLQSVLYKPDDKVSIDAPDVRVLMPGSGSETTPITSVTLKPNDTTAVPVLFTGFPSAGRYEATLRFEPPASAPEMRTVSIYVRESSTRAALWILLGVVVAFALRVYGTVLAPRLALETRTASLFNEMALARTEAQASSDADGVVVVDVMHATLATRWNTLATNSRLIGAADLDALESKVPLLRLWLQLRDWLRMNLPPNTHSLARDTLAATQTVLCNAAATVAEVSTQIASLSALPLRLEQSAEKEIDQALSDFRRVLNDTPDSRLDAARDRLKGLEATKPVGGPSLVKFAQTLNELRQERVDLLIKDLKAMLRGAAPRLIDAAEWQGLVAHCARILDDAPAHVDGRIEAYTSAFARIATPVATKVETEAQVAVASGTEPLAGWKQAAANARIVLNGLSDKPPRGAPADLERLIEDSDRLYGARSTPAALGRRSPSFHTRSLPILDIKALSASPGASGGGGWLNFLGYGSKATRLQGPLAVPQARRREALLSLSALGLIALLTVLAGVQALWSNNWAWGGATAYLVAFLWGAGMSGFTFDGVKNLLSKWT